MKWIPTSERLPERFAKDRVYSAHVLFQTSEGDMHVGCYSYVSREWDDCGGYDSRSFETGEVVAWMPLPEPWTGGQA